LRASQLLLEGIERRRVGIVAVDIAQQLAQPVEILGVEHSVLLDAVVGTLTELIEVPARFRHANDRYGQVPGSHHRLERRKDLLERQIAGGAEHNEDIGACVGHPSFPLASGGL
jgi:hypothetical protein